MWVQGGVRKDANGCAVQFGVTREDEFCMRTLKFLENVSRQRLRLAFVLWYPWLPSLDALDILQFPVAARFLYYLL